MFLNIDATPVPFAFIENDVLVVDAADKAEVFNKYFADQYTRILTARILLDMNLRAAAVLCDVNFALESTVKLSFFKLYQSSCHCCKNSSTF